MKKLKIFFAALLLVLFFANLGFHIWEYRSEYLTKFDSGYWKMRYNQSQWVVSNSKNPIGDDGLYAHAGWVYINGGNPVLLNAEIPPLAKYIIGASEVIFQNQAIIALIAGIGVLVAFYFLNLQILKDKLIAFIPVFLFSFDSIFYSQLRAPYLDTLYLLFLLLTFLFALKKKYILSSIFLACFASTKYPVGALFVLAPLILWVFLYDKKYFKKYLLSLLVVPVLFVLTYTMYFVDGGTPLGFLGVQKWIVNFYSVGANAGIGIVYPMIFSGTWYTWFANRQTISEWNILWPVSFFGAALATFLLAKSVKSKKKDAANHNSVMLILLWVLSYLAFLTFTPVFPRYLLLLLPFMYNLSIWACVQIRLGRFGLSYLR